MYFFEDQIEDLYENISEVNLAGLLISFSW